jgi:hypothetical protein
MANKTQHFVYCVHCTDAFEKGAPGAREVVDVRGEKNAMESHLRQCKFYEMQDMQMSDPEPSTSQAQHPGAGPPTSSRTSTNHNSSKRIPLWPNVGVKPNTSKVGDLESSGTPENSELELKCQKTSHWGVLGVIGKFLKCRYRKWPRIGHLDICSPSYG